MAHESEKSIVDAIKINENEVGDHLNRLVRQSVEDTINRLPDAEVDAICNAGATSTAGIEEAHSCATVDG
ncbi:MAG: hypothetical protein IKP58_00360 [Victivallales bacterium]|nr:hypothetical protein [Victivallales bacterium]